MITAITAIGGLLILLVMNSANSAPKGTAEPSAGHVHVARQAAPSPAARPWALHGQARVLAGRAEQLLVSGRKGDLVAAQDSARRCLSLCPDSSRCHAVLADVLAARIRDGGGLARLRHARAMLGAYEQALRFDPANYRVRMALVRWHLELPFYLGASQRRARELATEPQRSEPHLARLLRAVFAVDQEELAQAEQLILAARLDAYPLVREDERQVLDFLARRSLQNGRYAASERLYGELYRRRPDRGEALIGQARAARARLHLAAAAAYLEQAARIAPRPQVFMQLGELYAALSERERAIGAYRAALAGQPKLAARESAQVYSALALLQPR